MADPSRTSFVIATRDRAGELQRTLTQLLDTTDSPIVVVDNDSRDHTRELVASTARSHPEGRRVELVALSRNRGAVARNIGVVACSTPYVAFCDDDSWWDPSATKIAEDLFDHRPTLALLAAQTVTWPGRQCDGFSNMLENSALGHEPGMPGPSVLGFQSCSSIVRACAFIAVGGFSPVLHFRGEEQLLALDLATAGWDLCYCSELVAFHHPSHVRDSAASQHARVLRNDFLTACMRRPSRRCINAAAALIRSAPNDRAYVRAAAEALFRLPSALAGRHRLPEHVERQVRLLESVPA